MIRLSQIKLNPGQPEELLSKKAAEKLRIREQDIAVLKILRKSVDARKKDRIQIIYQLDVALKDQSREGKLAKKLKESEARLVTLEAYRFPQGKPVSQKNRPVIVGSGPAGLFCAYMLSANGFRPIILERGGTVEERSKAVETFWQKGILDPECNVQFGEGGAGTFSDGKLNTLVKDPLLRGRKVLETFVEMGADPAILYEQKPHIGTDVLKKVLVNMREAVLAQGGSFFFHTKLTDICISQGQLKSVRVKNLITGEEDELETDTLVLAIGHSARDTFAMLKERRIPMQQKAFAVGLRIQHPQRMIQIDQYGEAYADAFPAAPYKVTERSSDGRGVYSFCMCPGGYVVNASSEAGMTAVNGMSYHARDGINANSAMIVTVTPEDFGSDDVLAGVAFQRELEKRAYEAGQGKVPVQLFGDFREGRKSTCLGEVTPCIKGEYMLTDLRSILPENLNKALIEGITACGRKIRGFDRPDALLSGVESRTSSPVKILRDEELESEIRGLYPCGEGAGYAGGITSAGMDGIRVAEQIAVKAYEKGC